MTEVIGRHVVPNMCDQVADRSGAATGPVRLTMRLISRPDLPSIVFMISGRLYSHPPLRRNAE
jgi:hypothetical protein